MQLRCILGPGVDYRCSVGARGGSWGVLVLTSVHSPAVVYRVGPARGFAAEEDHVVGSLLVGQGFEAGDVDGFGVVLVVDFRKLFTSVIYECLMKAYKPILMFVG